MPTNNEIGIIRKQPKNLNQAHSDKFRLSILDIPNVSYFCFEANIPGLNLNPLSIPTPSNKYYLPETELNYDQLTVSFRVDEDLGNYKEIFNWMKGMGQPSKTEEFTDFLKTRPLNKSTHKVTSDGVLMTLTNVSNINIQIQFINMFPISLTGLNYILGSSDPLQASVTFQIDSYEIRI